MANLGSAVAKSGGKMGEYVPLLIAAALIGGAIYVYSQSSGSSGYQIVGATNNSAERTAAAAANASAVQAHEANVMAGFNALVGEATGQYNSDTQVSLGNQKLASDVAQYATQGRIATLAEQAQIATANDALSAAQAQYAMQSEVAKLAAQAQITASNDALSAAQAQAHASQQNGLWSSISSIFSTVASKFVP